VHDAAGRFGDLTLDAFIHRLSSAEPVPGGGSASAVAAALGASLVTMVADLSAGRPRYADHAVLHGRARVEGEALAARFLELADEDASAYAAYASALKSPRDTEAEQAVRAAAIRTAARAAAEVPLRCLEVCRELAAVAESLAGRSNVNASSDVVVASLLAEAAARGAAANVLVNLPAVGDVAWAEATSTRVAALVDEVATLARATETAVEAGTARVPLVGAPQAGPATMTGAASR